MSNKTQFNMRIENDLRAKLDILGAEMLLAGELRKSSATNVVVKVLEDFIASRETVKVGANDEVDHIEDEQVATKVKAKKGGKSDEN